MSFHCQSQTLVWFFRVMEKTKPVFVSNVCLDGCLSVEFGIVQWRLLGGDHFFKFCGEGNLHLVAGGLA